MGIAFLPQLPLPEEIDKEYHVVMDAIFGFSFKGAVRAPFDDILSTLRRVKTPICSVDVPSGMSMCVYMCVCVCTCVCMCVCACVYTYVFAHMCVHVCISVCVCECVYVCMCETERKVLYVCQHSAMMKELY